MSRLPKPGGNEMNQEMEDRIRQRAYDLWLESGEPDGSELAFWLQAEQEIKGEAAPSADLTSRPDADN
jgi:hypothetical protein